MASAASRCASSRFASGLDASVARALSGVRSDETSMIRKRSASDSPGATATAVSVTARIIAAAAFSSIPATTDKITACAETKSAAMTTLGKAVEAAAMTNNNETAAQKI